MTHPHPRALEAAARAVLQSIVKRESEIAGRPVEPDAFSEIAAIDDARAAVTAYIAAMPPPLSPELIAKLNALASRLTEQGEYEAVDLIDTVVARVIDAAPPAEAGDGWMPIETAPKDGTKFLGYFGNVEFYRVTWWSNRQAAQHGSGWVFSQNGLAEPTHWMPLPAPPAAQDPRP